MLKAVESELHRGMDQKGPGPDVRGRYRWVGKSGPSLAGRRWLVDVEGPGVYTVGANKWDLDATLRWAGVPRAVRVEGCGAEGEEEVGGDKGPPGRLT